MTSKTATATRRQFVSGAAAAGVLGAAGALAGSASAPSQASAGEVADNGAPETVIARINNACDDHTYLPHPREYPIGAVAAPEKTAHESDVLVIGGGLAGLNAAVAAAEEGLSVVLVDKGTPGYSGLSAWPSCTAFYDPELDADRETWDVYMRTACDSLANLDWEDVWLDESKATYERMAGWGWATMYPNAREAGYWVDGICFDDDIRGYFRDILGDSDRRKVFMRVLEQHGVEVVTQTMVLDLVRDGNGAAVGATGIHNKSGAFVTFSAKSVVLCAGGGVVRSCGFPCGGNSFDGLWMAYNNGLPITGMEFDDFHEHCSFAGDNVLMWEGWQYLEPVWPTGGTITQETIDGYATPKKSGKWISFVTQSTKGGSRADWSNMLSNDGADCSAAVKAGNTDDPRIGKYTSPLPKTDRAGGAPGMPAHLASGVWCGMDELVGKTQIEGLFVAGDGANASYVGGPNYGSQRGSTSSFCSMQGWRAGKAAAEAAQGVAAPELPAADVDALREAALAPMGLESGFDPSWARDKLLAIIASPWVIYSKSEESLTRALAAVRELRATVSGKMLAQNPHELRLAHEVEHQMLAMELKILAGLNRRESRGYHYRSDFPFKDDEQMLCYFTFTRNPEDEQNPTVERVELKERWVGDLSLPYEQRYPLLETPEEVAKYAQQ